MHRSTVEYQLAKKYHTKLFTRQAAAQHRQNTTEWGIQIAQQQNYNARDGIRTTCGSRRRRRCRRCRHEAQDTI